MASINGITLKAVKMFRGHEGEPCYQGNVYIGTKKIGFWSQDSWGGCDNFMFDRPYSERKLAKKVSELHPECIETHTRADGSTYTIEYSLEILFSDLLRLQDDEKAFKMRIKHGASGLMMVTDGYTQLSWGLYEEELDDSDDAILTKYGKFIEDQKKKARFMKESDWVKHEVKIYRSLNDFNIGVAVTLDDIKEN
jgi:hypothetical protein